MLTATDRACSSDGGGIDALITHIRGLRTSDNSVGGLGLPLRRGLERHDLHRLSWRQDRYAHGWWTAPQPAPALTVLLTTSREDEAGSSPPGQNPLLQQAAAGLSGYAGAAYSGSPWRWNYRLIAVEFGAAETGTQLSGLCAVIDRGVPDRPADFKSLQQLVDRVSKTHCYRTNKPLQAVPSAVDIQMLAQTAGAPAHLIEHVQLHGPASAMHPNSGAAQATAHWPIPEQFMVSLQVWGPHRMDYPRTR